MTGTSGAPGVNLVGSELRRRISIPAEARAMIISGGSEGIQPDASN